MAKQTSLYLTQDIVNQGQIFSSFGDSGIYKTIFTAGNNDSLVKSINVVATVTGANAPASLVVPMQFAISGSDHNDPSLIYPLATASIPPMAGSGAVPAFSVFSATGTLSFPKDNAGNIYYPMSSGTQLVARYFGGLSTHGQIVVVTTAENY